ncbi:MAG: acyl-ACP--UDP-N-acetylglucosamine O-acyltransferase [Myxococcota bacterium]
MIHPTAIVDPSAELGDVELGPYVVVGPRVRLHDRVRLGAHSVVESDTEIGPGTVLHAHVVLGGAPQDLKHDPSVNTTLVVGADNVFREFTTAHRGTSAGRGTTRIGSRNYFMANSHVAHDCWVGDDVMFANSAAIAGHVDVGNGAILGGLSAVHQHARVGRLAMVGGGAMCAQDVPPFTLAQGDRARLYGVNIVGLRRAGLGDSASAALKDAWRVLFASDLPWKTALTRVDEAHGSVPEVAELLTFLRGSTRGVCRAGVQT